MRHPLDLSAHGLRLARALVAGAAAGMAPALAVAGTSPAPAPGAASAAGAAGAGEVPADVAALARDSQAFSDASASGDAATLARLLDDHVTFIDESGHVLTRRDIVDGASPPPAGVDQTLVQEDFHVSVHGHTAVTSFVDQSTLRFHGQVLHADYLSTETWIETPAGWKMIQSQTLALQQDPPAVTLPPATLDDYVGTYRAGGDYEMRIVRQGGTLLAATNGGAPVAMRPELRDVFFVPGLPRMRRIFQRDATGRVTGFVSRREGRDVVLRRVG